MYSTTHRQGVCSWYDSWLFNVKNFDFQIHLFFLGDLLIQFNLGKILWLQLEYRCTSRQFSIFLSNGDTCRIFDWNQGLIGTLLGFSQNLVVVVQWVMVMLSNDIKVWASISGVTEYSKTGYSTNIRLFWSYSKPTFQNWIHPTPIRIRPQYSTVFVKYFFIVKLSIFG